MKIRVVRECFIITIHQFPEVGLFNIKGEVLTIDNA